MDEEIRSRLLALQQMEATEAEVYHRLAARQKDPHNREILERIAADEERHESILAEKTGEQVKPQMSRVRYHLRLARLFGLTFAVKMLERVEKDAASEYRELEAAGVEGLAQLAEEEDAHELALIGMLQEGKLQYIGSVVLGLSDALVELTGALAGLTFAFANMQMVALAGLIMGIAAAFSMGASEFLSTRAEGDERSPLKAGFFTWIAYLLTVAVLVTPFLLLDPNGPLQFGLEPHVQALALTFISGLFIVAIFNYYISVAQDQPFKQRFAEMAGILTVVTLISFAIGILLRSWFGL